MHLHVDHCYGLDLHAHHCRGTLANWRNPNPKRNAPVVFPARSRNDARGTKLPKTCRAVISDRGNLSGISLANLVAITPQINGQVDDPI